MQFDSDYLCWARPWIKLGIDPLTDTWITRFEYGVSREI